MVKGLGPAIAEHGWGTQKMRVRTEKREKLSAKVEHPGSDRELIDENPKKDGGAGNKNLEQVKNTYGGK